MSKMLWTASRSAKLALLLAYIVLAFTGPFMHTCQPAGPADTDCALPQLADAPAPFVPPALDRASVSTDHHAACLACTWASQQRQTAAVPHPLLAPAPHVVTTVAWSFLPTGTTTHGPAASRAPPLS
jgi:hypothetical protein